jgi:transcriptional regulator GlxA family with amidase domain
MNGMDRARNVAVVAYEKMDLLDLAGPFDVFAVASNWGRDFRVYTVAEKAGPVKTVSGITISPKYGFGDCPEPDILVVPGGLGARTEMHNEALTGWIRSAAEGAEIVLSVCTGALLLAKAGLLDGLRVTTNRRALDLLREAAPPDAVIVEEARYVDNGKIVLSGGVTTGFDAALHIVSRLYGMERALEVASRLEYRWNAEEAGGPV